MSDAEYEGPSLKFGRRVKRRARKEHDCYLCHEPIEKGQLYEYSVHMTDEDDKPRITKAHGYCEYGGTF